MNLHDIDELIEAFYDSISGPAGAQDWKRSALLFHPDARLVRTRLDESGSPVAFSFSVNGYREATAPLLAGMDFYEVEIARRTVRFGNVAQLFSAYEARDKREGGALIKRGMNMIHLFDDGRRWWIMHVIWDDEREGVSLPREIFGGRGLSERRREGAGAALAQALITGWRRRTAGAPGGRSPAEPAAGRSRSPASGRPCLRRTP